MQFEFNTVHLELFIVHHEQIKWLTLLHPKTIWLLLFWIALILKIWLGKLIVYGRFFTFKL